MPAAEVMLGRVTGWGDKRSCQGKIDAKVFHGEACPADEMISVGTRARMHQSPSTMVSRIFHLSERVLPTTEKSVRPHVVVQNVNLPEYVGSVDAIKYETMRKALLKVLPRTKPGPTQVEMGQQVPAHLSQDEFPGGAKAGWRVKCVQLDLEAKGVITRDSAAKPLRWHRLK